MQVYKNIARLPRFTNAVITIGTFDGVHLGHVKIIGQLLKEAQVVNGTAVLITFYPHPKQVLVQDKKPLYILNTQDEKYSLLHKHGIGHIVVVPFDQRFSALSPSEYIHAFLVEKFHPVTIIIGYDHRFGKDRAGDFTLLEAEAGKYGYQVKEIPEKLLQDVIISSTKIRDALHNGDIATAAAYLGYDYFFSGKVIEGNKLGRTIGYPTANIALNDVQKLVPANGVYAVEAVMSNDDHVVKGMMNIGIRPTVNGTSRSIEVNLFDFDRSIYGADIRITFKKRIRDEQKFSGFDALKEQLAKDREDALRYL